MNFIAASTIRELVKQANELEIQKEDVVSLLYTNQYVLTYYESAGGE